MGVFAGAMALDHPEDSDFIQPSARRGARWENVRYSGPDGWELGAGGHRVELGPLRWRDGGVDLHGVRKPGDVESLGDDCCVRTFDAEMVNRIMRHPKVYPHISDDSCPKAEDFDCSEAMKREGFYFLLVSGGEGAFMFHNHSRILYEVHTMLLPECWGRKALEASRAAVRWMFANTLCEKIITWVPAYNRLAYRFAIKSGMKQEGVSPKSLRKGGVLMDQYLLGMEKPCLPQSQ